MRMLVATILIMLLAGSVALVIGVFLLAGAAWALIAVSALLFAGAATLRKGLLND